MAKRSVHWWCAAGSKLEAFPKPVAHVVLYDRAQVKNFIALYMKKRAEGFKQRGQRRRKR
jgi:hypothetical protein